MSKPPHREQPKEVQLGELGALDVTGDTLAQPDLPAREPEALSKTVDAAALGGVSAKTLEAGAEQASQRSDGLELMRGVSVGRYLVTERLGAGGMGVVYAAYDPELDRKVALKLLHQESAQVGGESSGRLRLLREAQAMARLSHPNVIAVYDVGTFRERVFVAMEFVDGGTLTDWLAAGPRSERDILAMFIQAGHGLNAAHLAGLVHRDFKPDTEASRVPPTP